MVRHPDPISVDGLASELEELAGRLIDRVFKREGKMRPLRISCLRRLAISLRRDKWFENKISALESLLSDAIKTLPDDELLEHSKKMTLKEAAYRYYNISAPEFKFEKQSLGHIRGQRSNWLRYEVERNAGIRDKDEKTIVSVSEMNRVLRNLRLELAAALLEMASPKPSKQPQLPPHAEQDVYRQQYHDEFRSAVEQGARIVGFVGQPGVGKTHLAVACAKEIASSDKIVVVDVASPTKSQLAMRNYLKTVGQEPGHTEWSLMWQFAELLQSHEAPEVVVLDNITAVDELLPYATASGTRSLVVFTTAHPAVEPKQSALIYVGDLTTDEAEELVRKLYTQATIEDARKLAVALSRRALAIGLACAYLRNNRHFTIGDLCVALAEGFSDALTAVDIDRRLTSLYRMVVSRLSDRALELLKRMLLWPINSINIEEAPTILADDPKLDREVSIGPLARLKFHSARDELVRNYLLTEEYVLSPEEHDSYRLGMHMFSYRMLRDLLSDSLTEARIAYSNAIMERSSFPQLNRILTLPLARLNSLRMYADFFYFVAPTDLLKNHPVKHARLAAVAARLCNQYAAYGDNQWHRPKRLHDTYLSLRDKLSRQDFESPEAYADTLVWFHQLGVELVHLHLVSIGARSFSRMSFGKLLKRTYPINYERIQAVTSLEWDSVDFRFQALSNERLLNDRVSYHRARRDYITAAEWLLCAASINRALGGMEYGITMTRQGIVELAKVIPGTAQSQHAFELTFLSFLQLERCGGPFTARLSACEEWEQDRDGELCRRKMRAEPMYSDTYHVVRRNYELFQVMLNRSIKMAESTGDLAIIDQACTDLPRYIELAGALVTEAPLGRYQRAFEYLRARHGLLSSLTSTAALDDCLCTLDAMRRRAQRDQNDFAASRIRLLELKARYACTYFDRGSIATPSTVRDAARLGRKFYAKYGAMFWAAESYLVAYVLARHIGMPSDDIKSLEQDALRACTRTQYSDRYNLAVSHDLRRFAYWILLE